MWSASASLLPFLVLESELIRSNSLFFTNLSRANITIETHSNSTRKLYWLLLLKRLLHTIITTLPMVIFFLVTMLSLLSYQKAVVQRCSVKKVFLKISQNSQKNTCARVFFLIKLKGLRRLMFCPMPAMIWCFYFQLFRFIKKTSISLSNITKPSLK